LTSNVHGGPLTLYDAHACAPIENGDGQRSSSVPHGVGLSGGTIANGANAILTLSKDDSVGSDCLGDGAASPTDGDWDSLRGTLIDYVELGHRLQEHSQLWQYRRIALALTITPHCDRSNEVARSNSELHVRLVWRYPEVRRYSIPATQACVDSTVSGKLRAHFGGNPPQQARPS